MNKKMISILFSLLIASQASFAAKIQQQGIKTATDCTNAGASLSSCLPLDSQIYSSVLSKQLSTAISDGSIAGVTSGDFVLNAGLSSSVSSNNLTVNLVTSSGATPTSTSQVVTYFRHTTATTGQYLSGAVTAALSITANSGASFGCANATDCYLYVYEQYNSGTPELCLSGSDQFDENSLHTTTTVSSGATSSNVLYCSTGRSSQPIRSIGRLLVNETTAGTYASNATEVSVTKILASRPGHLITRSTVVLDVEAGSLTTACTADPCTTSLTKTGGFGAFNRSSTGTYVAHFTGSPYSSTPWCTVTAFANAQNACNINQISTSQVTIICYNTSSGSAGDNAFQISCVGNR